MRLPATIARLAELTGELASSTSDGLSERVVKNAVWTTIAAAVSIREFVSIPPLRPALHPSNGFRSPVPALGYPAIDPGAVACKHIDMIRFYYGHVRFE